MNTPRPRRRLLRRTAKGLLLLCVAAGAWQAFKVQPAGLGLSTPLRGDAQPEFLADLTWEDAQGHRQHRQRIFDAMLEMIAAARQLIVADLFLFNDFGSEQGGVLRPLSGELTAALLARRAAVPGLRVVLITDPINTVYGGMRSPHLERLRAAGVEVLTTDLAGLPASNPLWSGPWTLCCAWAGNDPDGGWLPNVFGNGQVTLRSYLNLLNFRANHRKTLAADDGLGGWTGLVTSANPHDASSAHGNVALRFRGTAVLDLIGSEQAVPVDVPALFAPPIPLRTDGNGDGAGLQIVSEQAIRDALLAATDAAQAADRIDIAVFYLSHRPLVEALLAAQQRGVALRVLLDPNEDAFGRKKNGVPNRQVAAELHAAGVPLRWCDTHGEQCHAKLLRLTRANGRGELILGSANFTRRNLDGLNLETSVRLVDHSANSAFSDADAYFDALWNNSDGRRFSLDYGAYQDSSRWRRLYYRLGEASGLSTY